MAKGEAIINIARKLASNDKAGRDKCFQRLRMYLENRAGNLEGFRYEDFLNLWKGLHYSLWMTDLSPVQEDLSRSIASLIHVLSVNVEVAMLFIKTYWKTQCREWNTIDFLRIDKFMRLVRFMIREAFVMLARRQWQEDYVNKFCEVLSEDIASPVTFSAAPNGLRFHVMTVYVHELQNLMEDDKQKLPIPNSSTTLQLIEPYCQILALCTDSSVRQTCEENIFGKIENIYRNAVKTNGESSVKFDLDQIAEKIAGLETIVKSSANKGTVRKWTRRLKAAAQKNFPKTDQELLMELKQKAVKKKNRGKSKVSKMDIEHPTTCEPKVDKDQRSTSIGKKQVDIAGKPGNGSSSKKDIRADNADETTVTATDKNNHMSPNKCSTPLSLKRSGKWSEDDSPKPKRRKTGEAPSNTCTPSNLTDSQKKVKFGLHLNASQSDMDCIQKPSRFHGAGWVHDISENVAELEKSIVDGYHERSCVWDDFLSSKWASSPSPKPNVLPMFGENQLDQSLNAFYSDDCEVNFLEIPDFDLPKPAKESPKVRTELPKSVKASKAVLQGTRTRCSKRFQILQQQMKEKCSDSMDCMVVDILPTGSGLQTKYVRPHQLSPSDNAILLSLAWLNDTHINLSQALLAQQFPWCAGLENCCLGASFSKTSFSKHSSKEEFVQVCNPGGNHWITISNIACPPGQVFIYDSLYRKVTNDYRRIIDCLLDKVTSVICPKFQRQTNSSDCGCFAIAAATMLLHNKKDVQQVFNPKLMRPHLSKCFKSAHLEEFPIIKSKVDMLPRKTFKLKVKGSSGR